MTAQVTNRLTNQVPKFEDLRITTMTVVMTMEGKVDLDSIFNLLEIVRLDADVLPRRSTTKIKMPFCAIPGSIISARYQGRTRGLLKSKGKGYFKNSITIDMSASSKNVNLKLSSNKIQMCGASSEAMALEAGKLIIQNILRVDDMLSYMNDHPTESLQVVAWIKKHVKGDLCVIPVEGLGGPMMIHTIQLPEALPTNLNQEIALFLLKQAPDFLSYDEYCAHLDKVLTLKSVVERPLSIRQIKKVMVNYNYDLGFKIDRWNLALKMHRLNGFTTRYDNTVDYSVTISLPYTLPEESNIHRRKNKNPHHIFIVYKSGLVTQTGPSEELMKSAYELFISTILDLKSDISKPDPAEVTPAPVSSTSKEGKKSSTLKRIYYIPSSSEDSPSTSSTSSIS